MSLICWGHFEKLFCVFVRVYAHRVAAVPLGWILLIYTGTAHTKRQRQAASRAAPLAANIQRVADPFFERQRLCCNGFLLILAGLL